MLKTCLKNLGKKLDDMVKSNQKHIKEELLKGRTIDKILTDSQIIRVNQLSI